jgi:hypothetical protein
MTVRIHSPWHSDLTSAEVEARHRSNRSGYPAPQPSWKTTLFVRTREDRLVPAPRISGQASTRSILSAPARF